MPKCILLAGIFLVLASCQSITAIGDTFQGANDFRIVSVPNGWSDDIKDNLNTVKQNTVAMDEFTRFQLHPSSDDIAKRPVEFFSSGDFIELKLKTAFFANFTEGIEQIVLNRAVDLITSSPLKGEIAIIVDVTEGATSASGRDDKGNLIGRVVYYSDDVYLRQLGNEFNIPIYGPKRYEGGQLTVSMWVIELDKAESQELGAVLGTLANVAATASGQSLQGLNILSSVGSAFLNSNKDDVIGRIRFTLVPPMPGQPLTDPILQTSDVIISRTADRNATQVFDGCEYNPFRAMMYCNGNLPNSSLFVVSIRKARSQIDLTPTENWTAFSNAIASTPDVPNFDAAVTILANNSAKAANEATALRAVEKVLDPLTSDLVRSHEADLLLLRIQCSLLVTKINNLQEADLNEVCGDDAKQRQISIQDIDSLIRV